MDLAVPDNTNYQVPSQLPSDCFRTYDIRGPVDSANITTDLAYAIGLAVGTEIIKSGHQEVAVARDARLSGPKLCDALISGLLKTGVNVIFIGVVPSPVLYFATHRLSTNSGVMLTASHNPAHHNGFKIVLNGKTLMKEGVQALYQRIQKQAFVFGEGSLTEQQVVDDYINYITQQINLARPLKIVIDCGNGVAGDLAPKLYRKLSCEVIELFCEVDGRFPNHHPDPTIPANLQDLIKTVKANQAAIGLAFDGDADRLGVVTNQGEIIWPDRQMMLFSQAILANQPGAEIIFDVKCSRHLPEVIKQYGGKPVMWRTGHSVIKSALFERDAPFAGELSGHIFFRDQWFGFDDGLYVGARLLQLVAATTKTVAEIFAEFPDGVNTPELKIAIAEADKQIFMQRLVAEGEFNGAELVTIDGIRIEFNSGWALVRPSNTSPYLTLRFEAENEAELQRIQQLVVQQIQLIDPKLKIDFI